MPRVPGDVPQVPFQPTQMPGYAAPAVQPSQNFNPQQLQQLAAGVQDLGQASSRIGSAMQREELIAQQAQEQEQERQQARMQREQDRLDDAGAKEAINQFRTFAADKSSEYGRLTGKEAAEGLPKYLSDIDKYAEDLRKGLANDTQRKIFGDNSMLFGGEVRRKMSDYAYEQNSAYQKSTAAGAAVLDSRSYVESTVDEFEKDKKIRESNGAIPRTESIIDPKAYRASMEANIRWAMEGQPEEKIKVEIDNAVKALHSDTLEKFASKKHFAAINSYIDANESEIDPKVVMDYRKMAESTKASIDASKYAIALAGQFRNKNGYYGNEEHSVAMQSFDALYFSGNSGLSEETYKQVKAASRSLMEADSGIRNRIEAGLVDAALKQIEFQKSAQARESYSDWASSTSAALAFDASPVEGPDPEVIPIVADDAEQAERAFAASNPVLYAKLEAAGKLKELRDNFKGGGKSDPSAVAEIERNINDDPSFLSKYDIEKFDATYGLRLSPADYEMYRNKLASARGKSMESANVLSENSMNLMLNRSLLDHKLVIDLTGKVEDEDNEQDVAATKADIRHEWDRWSAEFSKRNSGKSPGREEFRDFLKSYWNDREVTGIDKRVSEFTDEDLSKVFVAHTDRISNKTYSSSLADIDDPLFDLAIARANKLNSELYAVESNKVVIARFATYAEAEAYKSSRIARERASNYGLSTQDLVVDKKPIVNTSKNSTDIGKIAMELLANGEYESAGDAGKFALTAPNTAKRTDAILTFYGGEKSNAAANDGIVGNTLSLAAASMSSLTYEEVKDVKKAGRISIESSFRKKVESLRDDIHNDQSVPSFEINQKTAMALTGLSFEKLKTIGAIKEQPNKAYDEMNVYEPVFKTTSKFNEMVKETYDYTVQSLNKNGYR